MTLDDYMDSMEDDNEWHDNDKLNKEKIWVPNICPSCGTEAEHIRGIEWKCNNSDCDTLHYFDWNTDKTNTDTMKNNAPVH